MRPFRVIEPRMQPVPALFAFSQMLNSRPPATHPVSLLRAARRTMLGICSDWVK